MCDTLVIRQNGMTWFGKNSDREPGEAQLVVRIPPVPNAHAKTLRATYINIPHVESRHGLLLSKPFWIWGAEMGANDQGVVIGNEAVFTKVKKKTDGLIGMDLLRLALERGDTAEHALCVITELLADYGQGGICGLRDRKMHYDNSFIIADPASAWVLETAGRHWVAKKVETFAAISNCLTIGADFDLKSQGVEDFARKKGWLPKNRDFNFRKVFDTRLVPYFAGAKKRLATSHKCLKEMADPNQAGLQQMMNSLRAHFRPDASPAEGSNADICMHAGGIIRRSQTCGSMVSMLPTTGKQHYFTGTSAPCLSVFKPAGFDYDLPYFVLNPDERTIEGSLWVRHEQIHRRLLFDEKGRSELRKTIAPTETAVLSTPARSAADRMVRDWEEKMLVEHGSKRVFYPKRSPYAWFWKRANRLDGFDFYRFT
ncbi:MAG TPA: C69 family dipeptidase [Desulfosalsimonadaceae bacterium]|nr:C69 family dipeptidase [Desulfosalsimonadaceae bacterium]